MSEKIECCVCNQKARLNDYSINESALLICPNCGAEFEVSALLKKIPGEGEITNGEDAVIGEPDSFKSDEEFDFSGDEKEGEDEEDFDFTGAENEEEEKGDEEAEAEEEEEEEKEESVRVIKCLTCNRQWLGTSANKCLVCESKKTMLTDQPIMERIQMATREIGFGGDVEKVINKMFEGK